MHSMPYLIQNSALVWCVQRKVPKRLQAAVARILGGKKPTQVYLKKSLATKDRRLATRRAAHALADIDRILREAEALAKRPTPKPALRTNLSDTEIKRMAEYVYAKTLAWDERFRFGRDEWRRMGINRKRPSSAPSKATWASLRPNGARCRSRPAGRSSQGRQHPPMRTLRRRPKWILLPSAGQRGAAMRPRWPGKDSRRGGDQAGDATSAVG
jgi:Domain of unknown function (DUF6538)